MKDKPKELSIPPHVFTDPKSREMLRAWVANEGLHCTLNVGTWGDREAIGWGILLSDAARHIADAVYKERGVDRQVTLQEIRRCFNEELAEPSSPTEGEFVH
ncbi:MAG TPA: DUF5076 domain-containing protein [Terriglobales bacterium]|nr:DUF5076 domain-containing protein [Terriglobales bacterium]